MSEAASGWVRLVTGRRVVAAIAVFVVVSVVWLQLGPAARVAATGVPLPDTWRGYTPEELYAAFGAMGPDGRRSYAWFLVGDFLYPVLFAAAVGGLIVLALRRLRRDRGAWLWLLALPLLIILFDWIEDAALLWMVTRFPSRFETLARITATVTALKLLLVNLAIGGALLAVGAIAVQALRGRR